MMTSLSPLAPVPAASMSVVKMSPLIDAGVRMTADVPVRDVLSDWLMIGLVVRMVEPFLLTSIVTSPEDDWTWPTNV